MDRCQREAVRGACDTGRSRCPYYVWGEGPPLLFLHDLADTSEAFVLPITHLSRCFRCIAYDFPMDLKGYTHSDLVDDLFCLLDSLDAKQSYLYAVGFSASVALAALKAHPQRLPRAILQAPLIHKPLTRTERLCAWLMAHLPGRMSSLPFRRRLLTRQHHAPFADRPPELWEHFLTSRGKVPIRAVGRTLRMLNRLDLRSELGDVRQPVLLVVGDRDPIVNAELTEELLDRLPGSGRAIIEGSGHFPNFTHPEALVQVIRMFLTPPTPCPEHKEGKMPLASCHPHLG
jgi:3-oxoadipate enol-lactonase